MLSFATVSVNLRFVVCALAGLAAISVWAACGEALESPTDDRDDAAAPTDGAPSTGDASADAASDATFDCPDGAFCDEFERETVQGQWTAASTFDGGTFFIDDAAASSPTRSLRVTADALTFPYSRACVQRVLPSTLDDVTIALDARFDGSASHVELIVLDFDNGAHVELVFSAVGKLFVAEQKSATDGGVAFFKGSTELPGAPLGAWRRYSLRFDRKAQKAIGVSGSETQELQLTPGTAGAGLEMVRVGLAYVEDAKTAAWIDHVVIQ